jgi:hypothetical protein
LNAAQMFANHPVLVLAGVLVLLYGLRVLYGMREGLAWLAKALATAVLLMFIAQAILPSFNVRGRNVEDISAIVGVAGFAFFPKRSRHIPAQVRRRVISKHVRKTGESYDRKEHHFDHIVPFSKGGSHTADNLRVLSKKKNLRKGAKLPRPTDYL